MHGQTRHLAYDGQVDPQWIDRTSRFWYRKEGPFGKMFVRTDVTTQSAGPAFDHDRLAAALAAAVKQPVSGRSLPFDVIRFTDKEQSLQFESHGATWTCRLDAYTCARSAEPFDDGGSGRGAPPSNRLPRTEVVSPDGKYVAFVREHNLWVRVRETGEQFPLSRDGERHYDYALPLPSPLLMMA